MVPSVWYSEEVASRLAVIETDIDTYIQQKIAQWISGQADVNAEWDEYVAQLDALGLQELTDTITPVIEEAAKIQ
ncbi:MAG: hypothetical protein ACK5LT_10915 [Lachnospirales bacterium]